MEKKYFQIAKWIAAWLSGTEEVEEKTLFEEWRKQPENEKLLRRIQIDSRSRMEQKRYEDFPCDEGWKALQAKRSAKRRIFVYRRWVAYAAVALLFAGFALYFRYLSASSGKEQVMVVAREIGPGGVKARLILNGGQEIDLEERHGEIVDSLPFIHNSGNRLTYQAKGVEKDTTPVYHEIVIPPCGEYQLQLSDGTVIYLNAMTKLRFPDFFSGSVREVELEGEAYFDVAKNSECPFIVKTHHSRTVVYGTQFNVSAYPDEEEVHTTLIEGAVTVEQACRQQKLNPGEQWLLHIESGESRVQRVDVSLYTAWKDGKLRFNDARLEDIMRAVSRWYGVEISYEEEALKELRFGCNFDRHASIEPLLRIFQANGKIRIEQQENYLKIKRGR